jgi:hypothetical protein
MHYEKMRFLWTFHKKHVKDAGNTGQFKSRYRALAGARVAPTDAALIDWGCGYESQESGHPHKGTIWPAEDYLPSIQVSIYIDAAQPAPATKQMFNNEIYVSVKAKRGNLYLFALSRTNGLTWLLCSGLE